LPESIREGIAKIHEIPHAAAMSLFQGQWICFCSPACKEKFDARPGKFIMKAKEEAERMEEKNPSSL
jgi:YHS domain-containing protein